MPEKSVAVVTGASQGIGRATAIRLARDFEAVVLAARQEDELAKTACAVQSAGAESLIYALDLRQHTFHAKDGGPLVSSSLPGPATERR